MKTIVNVVSAVVFALALTLASAAPMHHKRHTKAATTTQPQIACTVVGCIPVQRGCHPEMGYTPDGLPNALRADKGWVLGGDPVPPLAIMRPSASWPTTGPTLTHTSLRDFPSAA